MMSRVAAIYFFISLAVSSLLIGAVIANRIQIEKMQMEHLILENNLRIKEVISKQLYKTEGLAALVIQGHGIVESFQEVSEVMAADVPALAAFLLAPGGVVTDAYPYEENISTIGMDFFNEFDHYGNREAILARDSGELVMGGPFILRQGIMGLAGRYPVYIDAGTGSNEFWGLVTVSLKFPEALDGVGLSMLETQGFTYELWRVNPDTNERQVIASSERPCRPNATSIENRVQILNAEWYLCISLIHRWYTYPEHIIFMISGLLISLLIAFLAHNRGEIARAKSIFLANMSHEIRTPLNSVIGYAELALEETGDQKTVEERLAKIRGSANTLLDIINGILDISKVESGKLELEKIPFDLREILSVCKSILSMQAREKGINLSLEIKPDIDTGLIGDPVKLRQVLLNLLSNAVKFTHHGIVELTVTVVEEKHNSRTIRFEVRDSGIGMTGAQMKKIFSVFVQSDVSTTRKYGGTGLGLTISKNYVELMGGRLHVQSEPGLGSKFSFELKFGVTELPASDSSAIVLEKPKFSGQVLVCEDSPENQEIIASHLSKAGLSVVVAENGLVGLEYAGGKTFDLIFMDIHMPVMDGMDAARRLIEMGITTPIIAVTANTMQEDRAKYLSAGMSDCLTKPFKQRDLWACLMKYLRPAGQRKPVDIELGIENSANDEALHKKMMLSFGSKQHEVYDHIAKAALELDYGSAHILAHREGSVAEVIGAIKLSEILRSLEKKFKENKDDGLRELMDDYRKELDEVLNYISTYST